MKHIPFQKIACKTVAAVAVTALAGCSPHRQRPNILLLMSDNQLWSHLGCYGDKVVKTPHIDLLAQQGVRFTHAFCAAPSSSPARAAMLTGQDIWRLEEAASLYGPLSPKFTTYPDLLETFGYLCGIQGKGWGPGEFKTVGRHRNPGGDRYENFEAFLSKTVPGKPWHYWFSSREPHRPYPDGTDYYPVAQQVDIPPYLPDCEDVRKDICDYYTAIEHFDREVGEIVRLLKISGQYDNTVIVVCSDNGWQMPRGLANLYDSGSRVPLIIVWPGKTSGETADELVNLNDLAPTFLALAGLSVPEEMTARSLLPLLNHQKDRQENDCVFLARERHAYARKGGLGYPGRAIRTREFLYIINAEPDRWPAGDPPLYGDVDAHMLHYSSPSKIHILEHRNESEVKPFYDLCFAKRPAEELYCVRTDPFQLCNLAADTSFAAVKRELEIRLKDYLLRTKDPRLSGGKLIWDGAPYSNERDKTPHPNEEACRRLGIEKKYVY
ncbi:MAG: sulfatase [Bacteroidales bacterium]|jgi:arylsulfatase A-like enzyme|nr:sulfatase [Bacteroidales bacterium]